MTEFYSTLPQCAMNSRYFFKKIKLFFRNNLSEKLNLELLRFMMTSIQDCGLLIERILKNSKAQELTAIVDGDV